LLFFAAKITMTLNDLSIHLFPWTVIESPHESFHSQCKFDMRVASAEQGGSKYAGPARVWLNRWKHVAVFYIMEPAAVGVYLAASLHDRFHYQIKKSEESILQQIQSYCVGSQKTKCVIISRNQNYHDEHLTVLHDPSTEIRSLITSFDNSEVVEALIQSGTYDRNRGNYRIDTGFSCGKSQVRDPRFACITQPSLLSRTSESTLIQTMVLVSQIMDMVCKEYNKTPLYRVDGIQNDWAKEIHEENLCQQVRNSLATADIAFGGHLDSQNDPRPLMCPVPVVHRIVETRIGPA
jgi:hypothetical protein